MTREEAYLSILDASAKFQFNIALILEAKAAEAEKVKKWILNHLFAESYADHVTQVQHAIEIHEYLIDVIEGMTKMENSLASNLKVVLNKDQHEGEGYGGFGGEIYPYGGERDESVK